MTNETEFKQIGPYEIIEQVGTGGMATVYKAYQPSLDRYVAVKVMHKMFLQDPNFRARFEREARIVGGLDHGNIVPIYDYAELNGQPYLVMKFIEGKTLKDYMREEPLNLEEIRYVMKSVCDALTYAHKAGVLHRDMKPSNIIIDKSGTPYLTDFGLARITKQGESTLSVDTMLGTPHYISPEQAQGEAIDARTDVYSTGVILYELVAGRLPFTGDSPFAIIHKQIYAAPPPPSQLNPDIPPEIDIVLLQALAKEPGDRYKTPNDLILAFEHAASQTGMVNLDASRVTRAAELGELISHHTPGGGHYSTMNRGSSLTTSARGKKAVIIPVVPANYRHAPLGLQGWFELIIQRLRQAFDQLRDQLEDRGLHDRMSESFEELGTSVKGALPPEAKQHLHKRKGYQGLPASDRHNPTIRAAKAEYGPPERYTANQYEPQIHRGRPRRRIQYNDEWGNDEASIRRRARQRVTMRTGFFLHLGIYVVVMAIMFAAGSEINTGLTQWVTSGEFYTDFEFTGSQEAINNAVLPLLDMPLPFVIALLWGAGLAGHFIEMMDYTSPFRIGQRRNRIEREMRLLYGPDWAYTASDRSYRQVRKGIENRAKRRTRLLVHAVSALLLITAGSIAIPVIQETVQTVFELENGVPMEFDGNWFMIWSGFILAAFLFHLVYYFISTVFGGSSELAIEREIAREHSFMQPSAKSKRKNTIEDDTLENNTPLEHLTDADSDDSNAAQSPRGVRLSPDGEFTESFVNEMTDET